MTDDYTPRYVGDLANPLQVTFADHEAVVYDLTAASAFSLELININSGVVVTGAGTWTTLTPATSGVAQYAWNAADVATAGIYQLRVSVTFSGQILTFDQKLLELKV